MNKEWTTKNKFYYFKGLRKSGLSVKEAWQKVLNAITEYDTYYSFITAPVNFPF